MNDGFEFQIHGLERVLAKMRALPQALREKGAKAAGRKAANLIRDAAKANALRIDRTETPLKIADNIAVQFASRTFRRTGDVMFRVGVRGGAKAYGNTKQNRGLKRVGELYKTGGTTYYWRFVELGTSRSRARPFLLPALTQNIDPATTLFVNELSKAIDRIVKKGG